MRWGDHLFDSVTSVYDDAAADDDDEERNTI